MAIILHCANCRPVSEQVVLDALRHRAAGYVDYSFGCLRVHGWNLLSMAARVADGTIATGLDKQALRPGAGAQYSPNDDKITLGDTDSASAVHEAIHALQDTVRFPTRVTEAEATAAIGEVVYEVARRALAAGKPPSAFARAALSSYTGIRGAAIRLAFDKRMFDQCHVALSKSDIAEVEAEVAKHPLYSKHAHQHYGFNGLRKSP